MSDFVPRPAENHALSRRLARSILLFTAVFGATLGVSRQFLLPQLMTLRIGETSVLATDVANLEQKLTLTVRTIEQQRDRLVLPGQDELSRVRRAEQQTVFSIEFLEDEMKLLAHRASGSDGSVVFHKIHYDAQTRRVSVRGDVRDVGPRSMTVLAQFTDFLEHHEGVLAIEPPLFVREHDEQTGFHSPFSIHFTIDPTAFLGPRTL